MKPIQPGKPLPMVVSVPQAPRPVTQRNIVVFARLRYRWMVICNTVVAANIENQGHMAAKTGSNMRFLVLLLALLPIAAPANADERIFTSPVDGSRLSGGDVLTRIEGADVVVVGEVHDNPVHHLNQAWVIDRYKPDALVAEMIRSVDEARIRTHLTDGSAISAIGPLIGWEDTGWPAWKLYQPIFEALGASARIYGASLPRKEVRRVMTEPASSILPDPRVAPLLDVPLPDDAMAEVKQEMIDSHCGHLPEEMAPMMVAAQRLRDASLASAVLRAREQGARRIVVIAGNGHARKDRGLPLFLAQLSPDLNIVVIGQVESDGEAAISGLEASYDVVWRTVPHDRPDPCEELRKREK